MYLKNELSSVFQQKQEINAIGLSFEWCYNNEIDF